MPSTSTTLFFSCFSSVFFSVLLLFSFLCFNPSSPVLSSLLSKSISFNIQVKAYDSDIDSNLVTRYESASYVHDEVNDPGNEASDPGDVSKPVPTVDEKDVVVLTRNNFSEFIASNTYVMVNFYAPWCYWSKKLKPEYSAAATMLKNTEAVLAKVDCTIEGKLCRDYNIQGYPSMVLFVLGTKKVVYYNDRTRWVESTSSVPRGLFMFFMIGFFAIQGCYLDLDEAENDPSSANCRIRRGRSRYIVR